MDIADRAQEISNKQIQNYLNTVRVENNKTGTEYCIDCDEKIPDARKNIYPSCCRCVKCQEDYESSLKRYM